MRVHDDVRGDTLVCEGHVSLRGDEAYDAFLAVAGGEFVADFWAAGLAGEDFDEFVVRVHDGDEDFVDVGGVGEAVGHGCVFVFADAPVGTAEAGGGVGVEGGLFHDVDFALGDFFADAGEAVGV